VLKDGKPPDLVTVYAGAVRIRVVPPPDGAAPTAGETQIWLDVTAEPRLQEFSVAGTPLIDRAIDDQGQILFLVPDARQGLGNGPPGINPMNVQGLGGGGANSVAIVNGQVFVNGVPLNVQGNSVSVVNGRVFVDGVPLDSRPQAQRQVPVRFKLGEKASKRFKELSGNLPVQALVDTEALATVDNVLKATGQTVKGKDGSALTVQAVEKLGDGGVKVQIALELPPGQKPQGNPNIPKLIDAQGKVYAPAEIANPRPKGQLFEVTLVYRPAGEPAQLVLYGQKTVTFSVPFTLKNVPLP
jgi:hypothetical protein